MSYKQWLGERLDDGARGISTKAAYEAGEAQGECKDATAAYMAGVERGKVVGNKNSKYSFEVGLIRGRFEGQWDMLEKAKEIVTEQTRTPEEIDSYLYDEEGPIFLCDAGVVQYKLMQVGDQLAKEASDEKVQCKLHGYTETAYKKDKGND